MRLHREHFSFTMVSLICPISFSIIHPFKKLFYSTGKQRIRQHWATKTSNDWTFWAVDRDWTGDLVLHFYLFFFISTLYKRVRLYLQHPLKSGLAALVSRSGVYHRRSRTTWQVRHGLDLVRLLTVIRVSKKDFSFSGQGSFVTYQGRALPTELQRLVSKI